MKPAHIFLACTIIVCFAPHEGASLSTIREGEPRIRFNRLVAPARGQQGETVGVVAFVTPLQNIWEPETIFFHLISPDAVTGEHPAAGWEQKGIVVNANTAPLIPAQNWVVGSEVQLGPVTLAIPKTLPPGKYLYQMGLFYTVSSPKAMYVREPYTNKEIPDWVLGSIEVEGPRTAKAGERVETMLSDFESLEDLKKWESRRQGEIGLVGGDRAIGGSYSAVLGFPANGAIPIVMLESFFATAAPEYTDWGLYDYLEFLIRSSFSPNVYDAGKLSIQVKDASGSRFQRALADLERKRVGAEKGEEEQKRGAQSGVYRLRLPIIDIAQRLDIENIRHLGIFATGLPEGEKWFLTVAIDHLKLVSEGGHKTDISEPFLIFEGIESPPTVTPGGDLKLGVKLSIARRFKSDYRFFIHATKTDAPPFTIHVEREPFRSTTTWEVGKIHYEGPIDLPIPLDAPPGTYALNVGLFKARGDLAGVARYVNTYRWSDGVYTEEQPSLPVDYIRLPYLNRTSKQQWNVGELKIILRAAAGGATSIDLQQKEMESIVTQTQQGVLSKPAPPAALNVKPAVKRHGGGDSR
ncbi:MAG: hypothetical protein NT045_08920 [Candidatus Aureabacteria bacterium]|nr:hypothetical protein [Candidatus Auribacterota bacterium]